MEVKHYVGQLFDEPTRELLRELRVAVTVKEEQAQSVPLVGERLHVAGDHVDDLVDRDIVGGAEPSGAVRTVEAHVFLMEAVLASGHEQALWRGEESRLSM